MKINSLGPEPSASTNSAIRAKNIIYFTKIRYVSQLFIFILNNYKNILKQQSTQKY